jgi:hypothetical protein
MTRHLEVLGNDVKTCKGNDKMRKLHNKELCNMYRSASDIKVVKLVRMGKRESYSRPMTLIFRNKLYRVGLD